MSEKEKKEKAPKKSWFDGLKAEFRKIIWPDQKSIGKQTAAVLSVSVVLGVLITIKDMAEANWYVVHTYSGYENKVKANIEKTIENRHLEDQILEVRVPMQEVVEVKNGAKKQVLKKLFPGYVLLNMIMNDDTWYVVRNTRGVTGFVGPGSKPVPLTEEEMAPLGIKPAELEIDFEEGDTVTITAGVWKDTVGVIQSINPSKQIVTINVELFGRETPVEIGFTEIKKM